MRAPEISVRSFNAARRASAILCPVIAGLDQAIHPTLRNHLVKRMDTRVKPAYDRFLVSSSFRDTRLRVDPESRRGAPLLDCGFARSSRPGMTGSFHLAQPRRIARHQVDFEVDLAAGAPVAQRRHIQ